MQLLTPSLASPPTEVSPNDTKKRTPKTKEKTREDREKTECAHSGLLLRNQKHRQAHRRVPRHCQRESFQGLAQPRGSNLALD